MTKLKKRHEPGTPPAQVDIKLVTIGGLKAAYIDLVSGYMPREELDAFARGLAAKGVICVVNSRRMSGAPSNDNKKESNA